MTDWQRGFFFGFIAADAVKAVCCAVLWFIKRRMETRRER